MQRLKKYLKNFSHDQQRWGGGQFLDFMGGHSYYVGDSYYEGDIELKGGPPSPPLGKTLFCVMVVEFVM